MGAGNRQTGTYLLAQFAPNPVWSLLERPECSTSEHSKHSKGAPRAFGVIKYKKIKKIIDSLQKYASPGAWRSDLTPTPGMRPSPSKDQLEAVQGA